MIVNVLKGANGKIVTLDGDSRRRTDACGSKRLFGL